MIVPSWTTEKSTKLEGQAFQDMLDRIGRTDSGVREMFVLESDNCDIFVEKLPFYQRLKLVRIPVHYLSEPVTLHFLDDGSRLFAMNGSPQAVYDANVVENLRLRPTQVLPYLHFFFGMVGGGRMRLVQKAGDVQWVNNLQNFPDLQVMQEQAMTKFEPARIDIIPGGNDYQVVAISLFDFSLYQVDIQVTGAGEVDIQKDQLLLADLPVTRYFP